MPLEKGSSKEAISNNISKEEDAGKPHDQAVAIALHTADEAKKKKSINITADDTRCFPVDDYFFFKS